tara:strand:- start:2850 stop:3689 length:840 start_codon:yes stop_codon:yes gene_type:complete
MFLKKVYKKKIVITGKSGLLGSTFYRKYSHKYKIISYPYRLENTKKMNKWFKRKDFNYFIHFAAITNCKNKDAVKNLKKINIDASINLLKILAKSRIKNFNFFLFISSSHVYGHSTVKIKESKKTLPVNYYGISKKLVEDFIIENRARFNFRIGIARIFNFTGKNQKKGHFIPDIFSKIKKLNTIKGINQYRDFIHIDDICKSIELIIKNKTEKPINISSGKKINLIKIAKIINVKKLNKKIHFDKQKGRDLFGDNRRLKLLGMWNFKNINQIIDSYIK